MATTARGLLLLFFCLTATAQARAQAPITYRLSFPAPEHRWMQVEATFTQLPPGPLQLRMSRTSPGRYALHEFAKNVFEVKVRDGKGTALTPARPSLHQWDVTGHDGTVVVTYKVYGDRIDGTYLSVDSTHAHMNIPATLMFARGLDARPARVTLQQPAGRAWKVATQLYSTADPLTFTAPNFQYLMDSPTEFSDHTVKTFTVASPGSTPTFRIALHHDGTDAEADAYARDTEKIVRETMAIFGEFPAYENNTYTFLADYLPWASGDGMEHRNSTVLSSSGALRNPAQREGLLGTVAHEFFHSWNMERIRSKGIEPFDFEDADMSGELWFGEGFTSYYDELIVQRAKLTSLESSLNTFASFINNVTLSPGRQIRTAEEMSRLAPFVDAAASIDRTAWPNTFISYYTWGAAIGLGLDLSLRDRTDGKVTLDDFMQSMWRAHGRPGQNGPPGIVSAPYTMDDLKVRLGEVAGSVEFARDFFAAFIQGHQVPDYARLLARAGFVLRKRNAGRAWMGGAQLSFPGGSSARVQGLVPFESPLYKAGVAQDDQITSIAGVSLSSQAELDGVLGRVKPGETVPIRFVRRSGEVLDATLTLEEDPRQEIVPIESAGGTLSEDQKRFRDGWLRSRVP